MAEIHRRRHICARVTDELRTALKEAAVQQTGGDLSALVRDIVLDWAVERMVQGSRNAVQE
jgi:hypothetical protein